MAIETKDLVGWGVTGGIGLLGLLLNWQTRRDAKRRAKAETDTPWSLRKSGLPTWPSDALFELKLEDVEAARVRLRTIAALRPRGVQLAHCETVNRGPLIYMPTEFADQLKIDQDLSGDFRGTKAMTYATVLIFARASPTALRHSKLTRLEISLDTEAISSSAIPRKIRVVSEPIDWCAIADSDPLK